MSMLDLNGSEQPMDPMLVKAIETAFLAFSLPAVEFVPVPRAWQKSNRHGSSKSPSSSFKARVKLALIERDGFRCAYCAREFIDLNDATLDHVIPNSVVGHWQPWNLVLACVPCNNAKADGVPLVLMPMLCHLLRVLEQIVRTKRQSANSSQPKPTDGYPSKAAARKAHRAHRARLRQRHQFYAAMSALGLPRVRPALEAAPVRAALTAGQSEA